MPCSTGLKRLTDDHELDVIALCCDFTEYESAGACIDDMGIEIDLSDCHNSKEASEAYKEYLNENTCVIYLSNGGIIVQAF